MRTVFAMRFCPIAFRQRSGKKRPRLYTFQRRSYPFNGSQRQALRGSNERLTSRNEGLTFQVWLFPFRLVSIRSRLVLAGGGFLKSPLQNR